MLLWFLLLGTQLGVELHKNSEASEQRAVENCGQIPNHAFPTEEKGQTVEFCNPQSHKKKGRDYQSTSKPSLFEFPNREFLPQTCNFTSWLASFLDLPHGRTLHSAFSNWHDPLPRIQMLRVYGSCSRVKPSRMIRPSPSSE